MMKSKEEIEGLGNLYLINETRKWVGDDIPDVYTQDDIIKAVAWGYDEGFYDATEWHYPSKGELPNCTQRVLICYGQEEHIKIVWWRQDFHRFGDALPTEIIAWQYIIPPKEEA